MKSLVLRSTLAGMVALGLALAANSVFAQGNCPHCLGGAGGNGGYGVHYDAYGYTIPHHDGSHFEAIGSEGANFGDCVYRYYGAHDLFYNYYVGNNCGGYGAALYLSPLPVPPHVGHTFITYQPLMPHEFMYRHHRTYDRYYNGGMGLTRTSVLYR
jgi:hypothetical protein